MTQPASVADIARRNGALSHGPITVEGKARSALNATRHGLCARTLVLRDAEDQADLAALRAAMLARHQPLDAAEAHWVEELVFVAWRQRRLWALEDAVLARATDALPAPNHPSQATLIRYRGRLDRDARRAGEELAALRRGRKALAEPGQLRGLANQIERARAILAACPPPAAPERTNENDRSGTNEPESTTLPEKRTNEFTSAGMNEPRHPVPPLPAALSAVPAASLNRHERRRLAALERRAA
jgi:hypothetical protein